MFQSDWIYDYNFFLKWTNKAYGLWQLNLLTISLDSIVGQVAITGKHLWLSSDKGAAITSLAPEVSHFFLVYAISTLLMNLGIKMQQYTSFYATGMLQIEKLSFLTKSILTWERSIVLEFSIWTILWQLDPKLCNGRTFWTFQMVVSKPMSR